LSPAFAIAGRPCPPPAQNRISGKLCRRIPLGNRKMDGASRKAALAPALPTNRTDQSDGKRAALSKRWRVYQYPHDWDTFGPRNG
jgi:hypothetical protein